VFAIAGCGSGFCSFTSTGGWEHANISIAFYWINSVKYHKVVCDVLIKGKESAKLLHNVLNVINLEIEKHHILRHLGEYVKNLVFFFVDLVLNATITMIQYLSSTLPFWPRFSET
jgi:hypothetical protein